PLEVKKRNYEFYEPKTNHGSSLSACIHSIIASEIGKDDDAYYYFRQSVMMDLNDFKNNCSGGIHSACLGGTWMSVINGFAGMRDYPDGLHFSPRIPEKWNSYSFKIAWKGRIILVSVSQKESVFKLISGETCKIKILGKEYTLHKDNDLIVKI
ncbi:MAG: glycosyl hydrolase family 65 protein, partial [Candidatus Nanoarchaeia archaeon]